MDSHGVLRVGGTRVTLDTVIAVFKEGATPEEIVYRYPRVKKVACPQNLLERSNLELFIGWRIRFQSVLSEIYKFTRTEDEFMILCYLTSNFNS